MNGANVKLISPRIQNVEPAPAKSIKLPKNLVTTNEKNHIRQTESPMANPLISGAQISDLTTNDAEPIPISKPNVKTLKAKSGTH
jgi:hypothetical protein